jgi:hypothetical protein
MQTALIAGREGEPARRAPMVNRKVFLFGLLFVTACSSADEQNDVREPIETSLDNALGQSFRAVERPANMTPLGEEVKAAVPHGTQSPGLCVRLRSDPHVALPANDNDVPDQQPNLGCPVN